MSISIAHVRSQGPALASLGRVAWSVVRSGRRGSGKEPPKQLESSPPGTPENPRLICGAGPEIEALLPPRRRALVRDYLRWSGADSRAYRDVLPPHLFPQWGLPVLTGLLKEIPYPIQTVLNQGCRLEIREPLPMGQRLTVRGRLENITEDGRKARIHARLITGTEACPDALSADVYVVVPLPASEDGARGPRREKPRVPQTVTEIGDRRLGARAGLDFALLTGDFNPIHWIRPYARVAGFKSTILHGFGSLAWAYERLIRARFCGDPNGLAFIDVRFTRPLLLPARIKAFDAPAEGTLRHIFVGTNPDGPAFLAGTYQSRRRA